MVVKVREPPPRVLPRLARKLLDFLHAAKLPHERLDVMRGAVERHVEQHVFDRRRRHARERPRLRVTQLPVGHGRRIFGRDSMARATRTFSRAAPRSSPHFQLSQCAHDCVAPSDQPLRRSNSAIKTSQR